MGGGKLVFKTFALKRESVLVLGGARGELKLQKIGTRLTFIEIL